MAKIKIYNFEGKELEELQAADSVFGVFADDALIHQVYVAQSANRRQGGAHTKTRGERAGSGKKPWRQKGTGRARVGSVRTPVWRKGGVVFGPRKERNYSQKINKKTNIKAILAVLGRKLQDGNIVAVETLKSNENKTKEISQAFKNLKVKGSALISFGESEKEYTRSSRNMAQVTNISVAQLNVFDMLNHKNLILSKESIRYLEGKYGKEAKTKE